MPGKVTLNSAISAGSERKGKKRGRKSKAELLQIQKEQADNGHDECKHSSDFLEDEVMYENKLEESELEGAETEAETEAEAEAKVEEKKADQKPETVTITKQELESMQQFQREMLSTLQDMRHQITEQKQNGPPPPPTPELVVGTTPLVDVHIIKTKKTHKRVRTHVPKRGAGKAPLQRTKSLTLEVLHKTHNTGNTRGFQEVTLNRSKGSSIPTHDTLPLVRNREMPFHAPLYEVGVGGLV